MKAWGITAFGKTQPLQLLDVPAPVAPFGPHEVLVAVKAASINPLDFKIRDGQLRFVSNPPYLFPRILGNDFAGEVLAVGSHVSRFKAGDRVFARIGKKSQSGTFQEQVLIEEDLLAHAPRGVSWEEAASLPLAGLTAFQSLTEELNLQAGQRILIHAGAGGVGSLAIQLAKQMGATVITTASPGAGHDLVESLGADQIVNYRAEPFEKVVAPVDAVLDTVGGDTLRRSLSILKRGGRVVSIAAIPTPHTARQMELGFGKTLLLTLASLSIRLAAAARGVQYRYLFMRPDGAQLARLAELVEAGRLRPVVDRALPFAEAPAALAYVESGRAKGKVVLSL